MSRGAGRVWIERILTLTALASLWPWLLGWRHPAWRILMGVMLAVMAALLVVNITRLWRMGHPKSR